MFPEVLRRLEGDWRTTIAILPPARFCLVAEIVSTVPDIKSSFASLKKFPFCFQTSPLLNGTAFVAVIHEFFQRSRRALVIRSSFQLRDETQPCFLDGGNGKFAADCWDTLPKTDPACRPLPDSQSRL